MASHPLNRSLSPRLTGQAQHFTSPALAARLEQGNAAFENHVRKDKIDYGAHNSQGHHQNGPQGNALGSHDLKVGRSRLVYFALVVLAGYLLLGARIIGLSDLSVQPVALHTTQTTPLEHKRADILDRNGAVLAKTLNRPSLVVHPRKIRNIDEAHRAIMEVLPELDPTILLERLSNLDRYEIRLKRNLTPDQVQRLNAKGIVGLDYPKLPSREYPYGDLFAHPIGFTDIDTNGMAGMEHVFEGQLKDLSESVVTSLDLGIQYIVRSEMEAQMEAFQAKRASAVLMNVNSGEILSMVSLPSFDPDNAGVAPKIARINGATQGALELGSTFKLFTVAAALDKDVISPTDSFDVTGPLRLYDQVIRDFHRHDGRMDIRHILQESSNIGAAKIGLELGGDNLLSFLDDLGMLSISQIEVLETDTPSFPRRMTEVSTATVSYGHGIAVSPLHVATGVSALVNGGIRVQPTLLKASDPSQRPLGPRVIRQETSHIMREFMHNIVENGTGSKAKVDAIPIGGKTGTAGKYGKDENISSFVSVFPIDNPQYVLYVVFDEPQGRADTFNFATAGWVAAPVTCRIITRLLSPLGIMPVRNTDDLWQMMQKNADRQDQTISEPSSCS